MNKIDGDIQTDIAIAGGGFTGLTLALALSRIGFGVTVVEAEPGNADPGPADYARDGRAFAIASACWKMWETLGLTDALGPSSQPIREILVSDSQLPDPARPRAGPGPFQLHFERGDVGDRASGQTLIGETLNGETASDGAAPLGYMVENAGLRRALDLAIDNSPVRRLSAARVIGIETGPRQAVLRLSDGRTVSAGLVCACDGARSFIRGALGIRWSGWAYDQTALVATLAHARDHEGVAQQMFLPNGPLAILPLPGRRSCLVWSEKKAVAEALLALPEAEFISELGRRMGDYLGPVHLDGPRFSYPLEMRLADRFVAERVALVGDAAHRAHPLAGQGLNLGLKDIAALAEVLGDARRVGLDPGALTALEPYERWRRTDAALLAAATDTINRVFSNDLPPLRALRGLGLGAVSRLEPLRKLFARQAAGETGERAKLLRGEPLW
jgi:2-octaprenyl-6-methoxyphenol hydroxylase